MPEHGALDRFVRHLAASHLAGARRQAKADADDLIRRAFEKHAEVDGSEFAETVFDRAAFSAAAEAVWAGRRAFLERELKAAVDSSSAGTGPATSHVARILGGEGSGVAGDVVRGAGIAASLAVPAAALFWNPVGWGFAAAAAAVGIALQVQQHFGKKMSEQSSERARKAKAQAIAEGTAAVDRTFDDYEDALVRDSRKAAWTLLAPAVGESLRAAIELRAALGRIAGMIGSLQTCAGAIRPAPAVADALMRAQRRLGSQAEVTRALLGEDWLGSVAEQRPATPAVRQTYESRREADRGRLTRVLAESWRVPSTAEISRWRDQLEDAARHDPALSDAVRTFQRVAGAKPVFAVVGDYNSGKSSLIRRIVVDDGRSAPATFDIRATPATTAATRYGFAGFDLLDTPGLQSGHDGHDAAAFDAVAEVALVFVVVQFNLLVGNTSLLEELLRGSERIAAKGGRMVFLVNRSDETGVEPLAVPEAFLSRQDQKREELRAALAARSVDIGIDRIHCLSGDPFGLVAGDAAAASAHFDANRLWDGVDALTGALSALTGEQLSAAALSGALDAAVTGLARHEHTLRREQHDGEQARRRSEPVIAALRNAVSDAAILEGSLREDARRMIGRHATAAQSAVAGIDRKEAPKLQELVESWWKTPQFEADLERCLADAARKVGDWHRGHVPEVGREMRAAEFQVAPEFATQFKARGKAWHENVTAGAGKVAGAAASLAKALGNREAVYAIGKHLGHNFKPWGAVKGAGNVSKAAAIVGVVVTAVDAAAMVTDLRKAGDHKQQQQEALRVIDETAAGILEQTLRGDGPVGQLEQLTGDLEALLDEHLQLASSISDQVDRAKAQAEVAAALITAAGDKGNG